MIYLCDGATGEARAAILRSGGTVARNEGEAVADFEDRMAAGGLIVRLPMNGREALAHPEAPAWPKSHLVMRALQQENRKPTDG